MKNISEQAMEIRKIWSGFQGARVLITANNYGLFDHLKTQKTAGQVARTLKTDHRATSILLDALAGLGLLKKKNGRYSNTDLATQFLVTGKPFYQGDIIKHIATLWDNWSGLDTILRTGKPFRKARNHEAFILGMHNLASIKAARIIDAIGMKGVKKAIDLGAGPGTYTIEMARRGIPVTLFDVPETIDIAKAVVSSKGATSTDNSSKRRHSRESGNPEKYWVPGQARNDKFFKPGSITFMQGDFIRDDIGRGYDLILMSQIAHSYSEKDNITLLKKCRTALNPGGRAVIQEFLINGDLTAPLPSALFSINMLVNTEGGRCYSPYEMKTWFQKAGFRSIKKQLVADGVLVSGRK